MEKRMDSAELGARLELATTLARQGGQCARTFFRDDRLDIRLKGPSDPVTAADLAVDRLIRAGIRKTFARDGILSEETGGDTADILWVIDPIDGTQNFSRGIARFAVSIAVCEAGKPVCGVVYDPIAEELFCARLGGGAFLNDVAVRTSAATTPQDALVEAGYSAKFGHGSYHAMTGRLLEAGFGVRQVGSAALGLAEVACGRIDGYCESHLESWDVAAASLLVSEAGGTISDFFGGDGLHRGGPIVAAASGLWERLSAAAELPRQAGAA